MEDYDTTLHRIVASQNRDKKLLFCFASVIGKHKEENINTIIIIIVIMENKPTNFTKAATANTLKENLNFIRRRSFIEMNKF